MPRLCNQNRFGLQWSSSIPFLGRGMQKSPLNQVIQDRFFWSVPASPPTPRGEIPSVANQECAVKARMQRKLRPLISRRNLRSPFYHVRVLDRFVPWAVRTPHERVTTDGGRRERPT